LVVQADAGQDLITRIVCPITSEVREDQVPIRPIVEASSANGLRLRSQVMTDKPHTVLLHKLAGPIGRMAASDLASVDRALAALLGLDDLLAGRG
jgi:mRNA interferase MazF